MEEGEPPPFDAPEAASTEEPLPFDAPEAVEGDPSSPSGVWSKVFGSALSSPGAQKRSASIASNTRRPVDTRTLVDRQTHATSPAATHAR